MKALVTGASGFIGSTLIGHLNEAGIEAYALLRKTSSTENLEGLRYQAVDGNLSDLESLKAAVRGMDFVFHLAGTTAARTRDRYFEQNQMGSARVIQAVAEAGKGIRRFIHVSSQAAAGPASGPHPIDETHSPRPVSSYGESKLAGESEVLKFKDQIPICIVRPPIVYGPRDRAFFVGIRSVSKNVMPILKGSAPGGNKFYSFVHVTDLCRGLLQCAVASSDQITSGQIFFLANTEYHSYRELFGTIANVLGKKPVQIHIPKFALKTAAIGLTAVGQITKKSFPLNMDKLNELLPDYWICNNERARKVLGFAPQYDFATGMENAVSWYKENQWI